MYFITKKDTETGKKFEAIVAKMKLCFEAQKAFADKYGFNSFRGGYFVAKGGISSCLEFNETPNPKIWGKSYNKGEFFPKKNSKIGKLIFKEIKDLPTVSYEELNDCVGFRGDLFRSIGFNSVGFNCDNEEYFGFTVSEKHILLHLPIA